MRHVDFFYSILINTPNIILHRFTWFYMLFDLCCDLCCDFLVICCDYLFFRERAPCVCRGKLDSRETGAAAGDHRGSRQSLLDLCPLVDQNRWTRPLSDLSLVLVISSYGAARSFDALPLTTHGAPGPLDGRALGCPERRSPGYQDSCF